MNKYLSIALLFATVMTCSMASEDTLSLEEKVDYVISRYGPDVLGISIENDPEFFQYQKEISDHPELYSVLMAILDEYDLKQKRSSLDYSRRMKLAGIIYFFTKVPDKDRERAKEYLFDFIEQPIAESPEDIFGFNVLCILASEEDIPRLIPYLDHESDQAKIRILSHISEIPGSEKREHARAIREKAAGLTFDDPHMEAGFKRHLDEKFPLEGEEAQE